MPSARITLAASAARRYADVAYMLVAIFRQFFAAAFAAAAFAIAAFSRRHFLPRRHFFMPPLPPRPFIFTAEPRR
jgi:hypothetical protein